ncbi:cadherin-like domain-containing protein, partial [Bosea sp. WAO]|uniref:cadherin-like domain-containing protein n=1 Tax=Bosea sp. WAO TaxID=406341 RepID=UPI000AF233C0
MFDAAGATTAAAVAADMHTPAEAVTKPANEQDHSLPAGNGAAGTVADVGPFGGKAEAQLIEAEGRSQASRHEIVFVDARLPELGSLTPAPGVELIVLDPERDGLAQVSAALAARSGVDAVHFVGHGEGGAFTLGRTVVDGALVEARGAEIASWSAALNADADLMIWGCDVAGTPAGEALLGSLAMLTGGDVAASEDSTGAQQRGGDWVLEARTGAIEAALPFAAEAVAAWNHELAPPTISGSENLQVAEPSTLNPAFGTSASVNLGDAGWGLGYDPADASDAVTVSVTVSDASIGAFADTVGGGVQLGNVWTFNGTMQQADAWLKGLTFTAADVERGNAIASTNIAVSVTNQTDGGTADRTAAIRVTASNDPTVLDDVTVNVAEVGPGGAPSVTILDGAMIAPTDAEVAFGTQDKSQIVYTLDTDTQYGYLTLGGVRIGQGSVFTQADIEAGRLAYVHTATGAHQNTQDAFVVRVNDGATPLAHSELATIRLDITPVNQAPTVSGDGRVYEGQPSNAQGPGSAPSKVGDYIVADGGGDPNDPLLIVRLDTLPTDGTLHFNGTVTIGGVVQAINRAITAADIAAGISFAYADRSQLTYAHNGVDQANGRPKPQDGFDVTVIDGGGGAGAAAALSASSRITLDVLPVNDEPVWAGGSLEATVDASHRITLDTGMLNVSDPDSLDDSLSFVVTGREMDKGRLYLTPVGGGAAVPLPVGGTFTLADVKAGRVQYVQHLGAGPNETDSFQFQVVDNGVSLHWRADGTLYERPSGIYDDPASETSRLKDFTFTIRLHETQDGEGGALPADPDRTPSHQSSEHAGTDASGHAVGSLTEGGTIVLYDGKPSGGEERPGLHYSVPGVAPEQIVYTVMSFDGAASGWNGVLQKQVGSDWVSLSQYDNFTQADLDAGRVRFVHDGGEDFESSVKLRASAGVLIDDGAGGLAMDKWITDFHFYATPVNDAPVATGSSENIIKEGQTVAITSDMLGFSDPDDATSEARYEAGSTLNGQDNHAANHDAANPLAFFVDALPAKGHLEWFDGASWQVVTPATELQASWLTSDPATTRLRYVHAGGEDLSDGFTVHARDRWGAVSGSASVGFVITPVNDAPNIAANPTLPDPTGPWPGGGASGSGAVNEPMTVIYEGSWQKITPDLLQAVDPDSSVTQVQYSITQAPAHGRLAYSRDGINFTTLGKGSSFTQDDIAKGYIYYQHGGNEPSGTTYPGTPDDKFVFTLSDGAAEVTGREFWIYVQPTNDAPVVKAPSGPINSTDTVTTIPGFSVSDPDLADGTLAIEADFLQVTVRLLDKDGQALTQAGYAGATLGVTVGGATVDATHNGVGGILVLRGTQAQINAALATLAVSFGDDRDAVYRVQVIADDRVRDLTSGALLDRDPAAAGTNPGGNGGGTHNEPSQPYTGSPQPVSGYDGFNWYQDAVPTASNGNPAIAALVGNIAAAEVTIRASRVNDPAVLTGTGAATVYEDQATPIGSQIGFVITDAESAAFGTPVTVTLSVGSGTLSLGTMPPGLNVTVSGANSSTMTLTGTAADIQAYLNAALRYQSATDHNHDSNGVAAGDVTLTVTFDDTGSNIGSGGAAANPAPLEIALTIVPVNDRPTVAVGSGALVVSGTTPVDGVSVTDKDIGGDGATGTAAGEADFVQVTIRLTDTSGLPLSLAAHGDVVLSSTASPIKGVNFEIDDTENGNGHALVIRGTREQVNAYLAGLTVTLQGTLANRDGSLRLEVVVDDRVRDVKTGALTGTEANGGGNNNPAGGVSAVPTAAVDPYAAVPGGLTANVNQASREIFPSSVNDPAEIRVTPPTPNEGSATVQLSGVAISDPDALPGDILTTTVTVPPGFVISSITAGGSTVGGVGTATVTISGTLDQINSAVNSIRIQLPDEAGTPDRADWNGTFNVTITVNDLGNNGGRPTTLPGDTDNPNANPGDFSYADPDGNDGNPNNDNHLVTTRSFGITVAPVNDAPVVVPVGGGTTVTLTGTEDSTGAGIPTHTVSSLFQGYFDDSRDAITGGSNADSFAGVVVGGLTTNPAQGSWQYFNGTSWVDIGPRTLASGLYLAADTQIRFAPAANFHGTPENLTVRLAEHPAGAPATGTVVDLSAANATGGTTRYSAGSVVVTTSVANVNDAPTLSGATLASVNEDTVSPPGETVANLFGSLYSDATDNRSAIAGGGNAATPFGGIAITGNAASSAQGEWQYSLNGADWTTVRTDLSDGDALLLAPTAKLRFVPAADFNGTPGGLSVRASDAPVSFAASADLSGDLGTTGPWSNAVALGTTVNPLNDAPLLGGTATNPVVTENAQTGTGTSLPPTSLFTPGTITLSDIDLTTTPGLGAGVFGAGEIELSLGSSYLSGDRLAIAAGYTLPAGVTIDAVHDGSAGRLVIKLAPGTSVADVIALIENVTYSSSSDNPTDFGTKTTRSYTLVVRDGNNRDGQNDTAGGPASLTSAPLSGTITIAATNDPPVAEDNVKTIAEDTASVSGNVILDPSPGSAVDRDPDTLVGDLAISGIAFGATTGTVGSGLAGAYGTLTLNADGSYSYALDNDDPRVNALRDGETLTEVFTYTLSDGSATDTATLTIT